GHARILQARPVSVLDQRIAVANATSLDFDSNPTGGRLGNFAFDNFKRSARMGDLRSSHLWHKQVLVSQKSSVFNLPHAGFMTTRKCDHGWTRILPTAK